MDAIEALQALSCERLRALRQLVLALGWPPVEAAWSESDAPELWAVGEIFVERDQVGIFTPTGSIDTDTEHIAQVLLPTGRLATQLTQTLHSTWDEPRRGLIELFTGWGLHSDLCKLPSGRIGVSIQQHVQDDPTTALDLDPTAADGIRYVDATGDPIEGIEAIAHEITKRWL